MDSAALAAALTAVLSVLTDRDATFARSLLAGYVKYQSFTAKQIYWVETLIRRASTPVTPAVTVDVSGIVRLFTEANPKLKYPKVRLQTECGQKLVLARAGAKSRYTGDVMLTDGEGFNGGKYYGRISAQTGEVVEGRDMTPEVKALLVLFASDPAGIGASIGKRTGQCCFCARGLNTTESLAVGYGPVCATQYNLPWG